LWAAVRHTALRENQGVDTRYGGEAAATFEHNQATVIEVKANIEPLRQALDNPRKQHVFTRL
jgi:hypothetical protein